MEISQEQYNIISEIVNRILPAYDDDGNTTENYSDNIILTDLSEKELKILKEF